MKRVSTCVLCCVGGGTVHEQFRVDFLDLSDERGSSAKLMKAEMLSFFTGALLVRRVRVNSKFLLLTCSSTWLGESFPSLPKDSTACNCNYEQPTLFMERGVK